MTDLRRVAVPAYVIAAVLILFPVMDLVQNLWPIRIGEMAWRVLAVGLLSRLLLTPLLGLLLAYAAALILEQPRMLRTLAVINGVLAVILVAGLALYALDALQMRARLADDSQTSYDLGIALSFTKYGIGFLTLVMLGVGEWRAASSLRGRGEGPGSGGERSALVFGRGDRDDRAEVSDVEGAGA